MGYKKRPKCPRHHPACSLGRQGPADKCVRGQRIQKLKLSECTIRGQAKVQMVDISHSIINGQCFDNRESAKV